MTRERHVCLGLHVNERPFHHRVEGVEDSCPLESRSLERILLEPGLSGLSQMFGTGRCSGAVRRDTAAKGCETWGSLTPAQECMCIGLYH